MNEDVIEDLKQFITTALGQEISYVRNDIAKEISSVREDMHEMESRLVRRMDDGFASVGDALAGVHDQQGDHETRITKLEQQAA